MAILVGVGLHSYGVSVGLGHINGALRNLIVLAALAALGLLATQVLPGCPRLYDATETGKWLLLLLGLLIVALVAWMARRTVSVSTKIVLICLAPVFLLFGGQLALPQALIAKKMPAAFLSTLPPIPRDAIVVADNYQATSAGWFWGCTEVYLLGNAGEYTYGLSYEDAKHRQLTVEQFKQLLAQHTGKRLIVLFTRAGRYADYRDTIRTPDEFRTNDRFVVAYFR